MFDIENTSNPLRKNFLPHRMLHGGEALEFANKEMAIGSPLVERLFDVSGVASVTLGCDYISIYKTENAQWQDIEPAVADILERTFPAEKDVNSDEFWQGVLAADLLSGLGIVLLH